PPRANPTKFYPKRRPQERRALPPKFRGQNYLPGSQAPPIYALNVTVPDFFKAMAQVLADTPIDDIKTYLRWHVVHSSATILATTFVDENFEFYGKALTGAKELRPRWKRCVQYTDG